MFQIDWSGCQMFKDALDQMKDDEYIDQLEQQNKRLSERVEELERQIYGSIQDYEGLYYSYQKAMSMMMRREEIEFLWNNEYKRNTNEYEGGRLDGFDIAMNIIDEALEGEANGF